MYISSVEIRKVLTNISKESGGAALINWIRPCENHFFWSATSTLSGNGSVIYAKFKSFLSHVINKHDNLDDPLYNKCNHGEIKHRTWLDKGMFKFNAMGSGIECHEKSCGQGGKLPPYVQFFSLLLANLPNSRLILHLVDQWAGRKYNYYGDSC